MPGTPREECYDLSLQKAWEYAHGLSGEAEIATAMTRGIDGEILYDPEEVVPGHTLYIYGVGRAVCANNAELLKHLCMAIGIDAQRVFIWGGHGTVRDFYSQGCIEFDAPAHDLAGPGPNFSYHAVTRVGAMEYDPSYPGLFTIPMRVA